MKTTKIIGDEAEEVAMKYLIEQNYLIYEQNYRYSRSEIDLIVMKEGELVFVEVKYRKNDHYGFPEMAVNAKKEQKIKQGAVAYIHQINWKKSIRFDIIAIVGDQIEHFQDAF